MTGWLVEWSPRQLCNIVYQLHTEGYPPAQLEAYDEWLLRPLTTEDQAREAAVLAYAQGVFDAG